MKFINKEIVNLGVSATMSVLLFSLFKSSRNKFKSLIY